MKISVNLATRPFVELRPFFLRLRIVMGALALVAIGLGIAGYILSRKLRHAEAQMTELKEKTDQAQTEKRMNERRMGLPANAEVLDRAHFLNALFLRKSFSWTAVMMDLENVLPIGVQVTSIEPQVMGDGDVAIRLRVSGDRDKAVQLVRNLERSQRFLQPRLSGEASQTKESANGTPVAAAPGAPGVPGGVEFDIVAMYNPLPANQSYKFAKSKEQAAGGTAAKSAVKHTAPAGKLPGVVLKPFVPPARPVPAKPVQGGAR
jgi:type IV pilus assembly protein PilN